MVAARLPGVRPGEHSKATSVSAHCPLGDACGWKELSIVRASLLSSLPSHLAEKMLAWQEWNKLFWLLGRESACEDLSQLLLLRDIDVFA